MMLLRKILFLFLRLSILCHFLYKTIHALSSESESEKNSIAETNMMNDKNENVIISGSLDNVVSTSTKRGLVKHQEALGSHTLKILTLGGSVTKGAKLNSPHEAYPNLIRLAGHKVVNVAIRATDAEFPSLCIQSMLKDKEMKFDVIMVEFSLNGFNGLPTLVKRLQYKYPDAHFIYLNLYSLRTYTVKDSNNKLSWSGETRIKVPPGIKQLWDMIQGYVYEFPVPENANDASLWFAKDSHHLNKMGHEQITHDLLEYMNSITLEYFQSPPLQVPKDMLRKWGFGDQCENWLMTGITSIKFSEESAKFGTFDGKFSLDFTSEGSIMVFNEMNVRVPLYLTFMNGPNNMYPETEVVFNQKVTLFELNRPAHHVAETHAVGWANPGANEVKIVPLEPSEQPFRLVGVALFGFSHHLNLPFFKGPTVHYLIEHQKS